MKDKNGTPLRIGDKVRYMGRVCTVLKYDKNWPSLIDIDDPSSDQKFIGAKKSERPVRMDEVEKI